MLRDGKIITIYGTKGNVGATFTSVNLAINLSKKFNKEGKVLLLDLNIIQPSVAEYLSLDTSSKMLDNLYPFAINKDSLTKEIIYSNCEKVENLYVLKGTSTPSFTDFVKLDILDSLLDYLKKIFDYIIIDTSEYLNNTGTYTAINKSDKTFIITTKNMIDILSLNKSKFYLDTYFKKEKFNLIINKEDKNIYIDNKKIEEISETTESFTLPLVDYDKVINSINKGIYIENIKDRKMKKYFNNIDKITTSLIKY